MENILGEEIPIIHHGLVNEFEEPSSNRRKRLWGTPDPNAKVVALSEEQLEDSKIFICDCCDLRFSRLQNLQYHSRTHKIDYNLPEKDVSDVRRKKVYICPEPNCIHNNPKNALNNITSVKKHYKRKHTEKSLKCDKCLRKYALKSDLDAHKKKCSTKIHECSRCGSIYSRIEELKIHKNECQLQGQMFDELVHVPETMFEVNVQVPEIFTQPGPSSISSINNIEQSLEIYEGFERLKFIGHEQLRPIIQMSDDVQQHSLLQPTPKSDFYQQPPLYVHSCEEKSIWDVNYWNLL